MVQKVGSTSQKAKVLSGSGCSGVNMPLKGQLAVKGDSQELEMVTFRNTLVTESNRWCTRMNRAAILILSSAISKIQEASTSVFHTGAHVKPIMTFNTTHLKED